MFSQIEKEALTELFHVSLGSSASGLSALFSEKVTVTVSDLSIKQKDDVLSDFVSSFFVVFGQYTGSINGTQLLFLNRDHVQSLVNKMEDTSDEVEIVQQMMQQLFVSVSDSMSKVLEQDLTYSLSGLDIVEHQQDFNISHFTEAQSFVEITCQIKVGVQSISFPVCVPVELAKQMAGIIVDSSDEEYQEESAAMSNQTFNSFNDSNKQKTMDSSPNIQSVQFSSFDDTESTQATPNNLDMLLDIPMQVTVELGRTKRMVKEILDVSPGSIIELDKLAGEPVDILVNNKLFAVGEVVVIDENFGVRVTDVLNTIDRISKLR